MFESNCRPLEVFLTLLMVICSRNLTVAYVQRILFVYIFLKVLSDSNLTQCSCLLLPPVIGGTEMCLVLLIYDVTFFSSLQGVLLGPVEKNGLKRVGNTSLSMYLSNFSHLCHPLKRSCSSQLPFVEKKNFLLLKKKNITFLRKWA